MKPGPEFVKKKKLSVNEAKKLKFRHSLFVRYIVSGMNKSDIISRLGITGGTYNNWLKNEKIVSLIEERIQSSLDLDASKRKKRFEFIHSEVYNELIAKIAEGGLEKMNAKNLVRQLIDLNQEVRKDTPGENIKKIDHTVKHHLMEDITNRYKASTSGQFEDKEEKIINIITPINKQLSKHKKEEVVDGVIVEEGKDRRVLQEEGRKTGRDDKEGRKNGNDDRGKKSKSTK